MAVSPIPQEVEQFLAEFINSVAELEGLLLLCRERDTEWDADRLAGRLYTTSEQTKGILQHLHSLGFLSVKNGDIDTYSYSPDSFEKAAAVNLVGEVYAEYLVPVTNMIHSKPQTRVQQFADAFKLRKSDS